MWRSKTIKSVFESLILSLLVIIHAHMSEIQQFNLDSDAAGLLKYDSIRFRALPQIPICLPKTLNKSVWSIVSNAADRSNRIIQTMSL